MTEQHPLTHEICIEILEKHSDPASESVLLAHVFGATYEAKLMRAAADWQLEQVIKCISTTLMDAYLYVDDSGDYAFNEGQFLKDLEKAMRPQQQEDN